MSIHVSTDDVPRATRLEYWRRRVAEVLPPFELQVEDEGRYWGSLVSETLGALRISRITTSPARVLRPKTLIGASGAKLYKLDLQLGGQRTVTQNGRVAVLKPGDFTLYDVTRPSFLTLSAGKQLQSAAVLTFPQELLPLPDDKVARIIAVRISGEDGIGALLSSLVARLASDLDNANFRISDGIRLSNVILDLISASLAEQPQLFSVVGDRDNPPLLPRIHSFIEMHLDHPDLSPAMIAKTYQISVRYLHKLFAEEGLTVAGWIRERRLDRCRRDLADPAQLHRTVSSIGAQWGFTNPTHFSYTFRRAFGLSPRKFRLLQARPLHVVHGDTGLSA